MDLHPLLARLGFPREDLPPPWSLPGQSAPQPPLQRAQGQASGARVCGLTPTTAHSSGEGPVGAGRAHGGLQPRVLVALETWRQARQRLPRSVMATRDTGGGRPGGWRIKGAGAGRAARREAGGEGKGGEPGARAAAAASASGTHGPQPSPRAAPRGHTPGTPREPERGARPCAEAGAEAAPRELQQRRRRLPVQPGAPDRARAPVSGGAQVPAMSGGLRGSGDSLPAERDRGAPRPRRA